MTMGDGPAADGTGNDSNLEDLVRTIVDDNAYMVLGTADAVGRPWVSPVFYAAHGHRDFYWISSPEVTHSRNVAVRPDVSIVVFDSRAPVGTGGTRAVYMTATAAEVPPTSSTRLSLCTRRSPNAEDASSPMRTSNRRPRTASTTPA
jgi:nitroimidazol reductase NimA-like FMN-containing flavoprotein (pyridoxamine 5'-phosphate oxidase superfamily)